MARLTILIGLLLTLLGAGFYGGLAATEDGARSVTALIPAFAGIPILVLGCVALIESARMHAMHIVAMLSLLGLVLPLGRLAQQLLTGKDVKAIVLAEMLLMAALSGTLLVACIRSFVRARLNRAEGV